jgi:hypothetical protein
MLKFVMKHALISIARFLTTNFELFLDAKIEYFPLLIEQLREIARYMLQGESNLDKLIR